MINLMRSLLLALCFLGTVTLASAEERICRYCEEGRSHFLPLGLDRQGRLAPRDAQPLRDGFIRASRRLFLTATPRLIGAARDADGELVPAGSMDDEALFGRVA